MARDRRVLSLATQEENQCPLIVSRSRLQRQPLFRRSLPRQLLPRHGSILMTVTTICSQQRKRNNNMMKNERDNENDEDETMIVGLSISVVHRSERTRREFDLHEETSYAKVTTYA